MEPTTLLLLVGSLACPIGMGLMMWLMSKNMGGQSRSDDQKPANATERLAILQAQQQVLEAEIAEVIHLAQLEAKREALITNISVAQNAD